MVASAAAATGVVDALAAGTAGVAPPTGGITVSMGIFLAATAPSGTAWRVGRGGRCLCLGRGFGRPAPLVHHRDELGSAGARVEGAKLVCVAIAGRAGATAGVAVDRFRGVLFASELGDRGGTSVGTHPGEVRRLRKVVGEARELGGVGLRRQPVEERVDLVVVALDGAADLADLAVDQCGVADEIAVELLAPDADPPLGLLADPCGLGLGPGMDARDVVIGELAKLLRFGGASCPDLVDVRLGDAVDLGRHALALALGRGLHGLGELVEEPPIALGRVQRDRRIGDRGERHTVGRGIGNAVRTGWIVFG